MYSHFTLFPVRQTLRSSNTIIHTSSNTGISSTKIHTISPLTCNCFSRFRILWQLSNSSVNNMLSQLSHLLCYANSAVNPIIYNFMSGEWPLKKHIATAVYKFNCLCTISVNKIYKVRCIKKTLNFTNKSLSNTILCLQIGLDIVLYLSL